MSHGELDTDTLLAIVASLLDGTINVEQSEILDALALHDGDVHAAVQTLKKRDSSASRRVQGRPAPHKRRRTGKMDDWLRPQDAWVDELDSYTPRKIRVTSTTDVGSAPSTKPVVDLMRVLVCAPSKSTGASIQRLPPLTLSTPALVAEHTPCTLHTSVLPSELACRLFHVMLDKSRVWDRNRWYLFDRMVESPHRTSFFARRTNGVDDNESWQEAATFWRVVYNGRQSEAPSVFPDVMEEACAYVEAVVDAELRKRKRFPLEWDGETTSGVQWRANVAASNMYEGAKETVGFHTDALTYLGPYPTIASISLGTSRAFRLREVVPSDEVEKRQPRTYNIPLPHNSLLIMHASTQERFKHTVPPQTTIDLFRPAYPHPDRPDEPPEPSNCRINITFRFYRPDFCAEATPRCRCGVPAILRPDMKKLNRSEDLARTPQKRVHAGATRTEMQEEEAYRYWWCCNAGAQNEGKSCGFWKVMDMDAEGRGPCVRDREERGKEETAGNV